VVLEALGTISVWTLVAAFEQTEDDGLAIGAPPAFAAHPSGTKAGFVGFKLSGQWRAFDAPLAHAFSDTQVDVVDRAHRYARQCSTFGSSQIQRKVTNNLTKLASLILERLKYLFLTVISVSWHAMMACLLPNRLLKYPQ